MNEQEKQAWQDLDARIKAIERERTRLRKGTVIATDPVLRIQLGGDCGNQEITAIANGPVSTGDTVTVIEGGGGVVVTGPVLAAGESGLENGDGIEITGNEIAVDGSVARKNGSAQLIGVGTPSDWNHGANKYYVDLIASLYLGLIPEVTSLPAGYEGQTVYFNDWLCRYSSSGPYGLAFPWKVLGGDLYDEEPGSYVFTSSSYHAPSIPMSVSIPAVKGIFRVEIGCTAGGAFYNAGIRQSYTISGAGDDGWSAVLGGNSESNYDYGPGYQLRASVSKISEHGIIGPTTIAERVRIDSGFGGWGYDEDNRPFIAHRRMKVTPIWIGP